MNKINKKKWLITVVISILILLSMCNLITFIVDPLFQYRAKDNQYIIKTRYCAPGLIKTYNYDTIIIGSSMTQNFDMDLFRNELNCNPLHIGVGGMSDEDLVKYVGLANDVGKADTYYLCIDIAYFASENDTKTINYLMKNDLLSKIQYAISYESLLRFIPIDIAFTTLNKIGYSLPESYGYKMKIDRFGYWGHQYVYDEDKVINNWKTGTAAVSSVDITDLYSRMIDHIDSFFEQIDLSEGEYYFFFPPYSSLFWYNAQDQGYLDIYLSAEEYFIKKAEENRVIVYYFQADDLTTDLNNYYDTTHYAPKINDWMTHCISKKDNIVTSNNFGSYKDDVLGNLEKFYKQYSNKINE